MSAGVDADAAAAAATEAADAADAEARGQAALREGQERLEQQAGSAVDQALRDST